MDILNIEIKSKIDNAQRIRDILKIQGAEFKGVDHQIDTYFKVASGKLKLREGKIENSLIRYERIETKNLKKSNIVLQKLGKDNSGLKNILTEQLGVEVVVDKQREIYFIDNVKFHIDQVVTLGEFVEIEAISHGSFTEEELRSQCDKYIHLLDLKSSDFIDKSYSDMI